MSKTKKTPLLIAILLQLIIALSPLTNLNGESCLTETFTQPEESCSCCQPADQTTSDCECSVKPANIHFIDLTIVTTNETSTKKLASQYLPIVYDNNIFHIFLFDKTKAQTLFKKIESPPPIIKSPPNLFKLNCTYRI